MRSVLAAFALVAGMSPASAEVWFVREGLCGEWRARWNVEQDQSGLWTGSIDHVHVGGPCAQGNGSRVRSAVHATIVGETLFATRQAGATICSYYGQIREERVRGVELCEGVPTRLTFALRFPPGSGPEARQQKEQRSVERQDVEQQDDKEWLDNPQTHDRTRTPPGFDLEFRLGPRQ